MTQPVDAPPIAQLLITLTSTGQIQIQGPIQDKTLCYGLMESAKDAIREHHAEQAKAGGLTIVRQPLNNNGGNGA